MYRTLPGTTGEYIITYSCLDGSDNYAEATRTVLVVTNALPGNLYMTQFELQTSRGGSFTLAGAKTTMSNVDPSTEIRIHWVSQVALGTEGWHCITQVLVLVRTMHAGGSGADMRQSFRVFLPQPHNAAIVVHLLCVHGWM